MSRVLINNDVASLYPNLVRVYGYSSRNQSDKDSYVKILQMRMDAKHNKLSQEFLDNLKVSNKDVKDGLKLIINSYTGTLRADFNDLNDPLQGVSICFTGQCLLMQLGYDLMQIPTVHLSRFNTDAVEVSVEEEYAEEVYRVVHEWEKLTQLEMEDDKIIKLVARDINNYCGIYKVGDGYEVHYKGGDLSRGNHIFKWDNEKSCFKYEFENDLKSNSMTIVSEAMLKFLLFNIPVEDTINNCNDVFRFQIISHLGSTYDKCVLKYDDERQVELQRNNRIYAGKDKTGGKIYKVKGEKYDSLANCPPNPIVDNKNSVTIEDINKNWYIKYTKQKIADFKGRNDVFMEEKLEKLKKDELIEMVKKTMQEKEDLEQAMMKDSCNLEKDVVGTVDFDYRKAQISLLKKIDMFRRKVRERDFILDKELPKNLGGGEIYSIDQIYQAVQDIAIECGLDFSFETVEVLRFDIGAFKPATGAPQNVATVKCVANFTDIDSGFNKRYVTISQGSDAIDKAVSGASSYAFRNWFSKNFTPKKINGEYITFGDEDNTFSEENVTRETLEDVSKPKTPVYVAPEKKKEIVEKITSEPQKTDNKSDTDKLVEMVYEYRELSGDQEYAAKSLQKVLSGNCDDVWIMKALLQVQNRLDDFKKEKGAE